MAKIIMIPEAGCWVFTGALNEAGYGIVGKGPRGSGSDRAHRVAYREFVGEIPEGLFVCHRCDVPSCCNPHHLFLGTNSENMADCRRKGRDSKPPRNPHVVGEAHPGHKLTADKVVELRRLFDTGWTLGSLAERYGVSETTVFHVGHRNKWRNIK